MSAEQFTPNSKKAKLSLTIQEVIIVRKMIEANIRKGEVYQDELDLGAKIQKFINEQEGHF